MVNSVELLDKKVQIEKRALEIMAKAQLEKRMLTEDEDKEYKNLKEQASEVNRRLDELESKLKEDEDPDKRSEDEDEDKDKEGEEKDPEEEKEEKEQRKYNMKNFSLIKAINKVVDGVNFSEEENAIFERGRKAAKSMEISGKIVIPCESRSLNGIVTANDDYSSGSKNGGKEAVQTDVLGILDPLRNALVFTQVGATYMSGLQGNIQIPTYSGSTVAWEGEVDQNTNGTGTFGKVTLSPKRLSASVFVSKQFLAQESADAEEMLKRDIVNALSEKLEATILDNQMSNTEAPQGIMAVVNGGAVTAAPAIDNDLANMVAWEADIEENKFATGKKAWIVSPSMKAYLKSTFTNKTYGSMPLLNGDEANGYKVASTGNTPVLSVTTQGSTTNYKRAAYFGDWRELIIAQWGAIDIVVDQVTLADKAQVKIVVNAWFDSKIRRSGAIKAGFFKNA